MDDRGGRDMEVDLLAPAHGHGKRVDLFSDSLEKRGASVMPAGVFVVHHYLRGTSAAGAASALFHSLMRDAQASKDLRPLDDDWRRQMTCYPEKWERYFPTGTN